MKSEGSSAQLAAWMAGTAVVSAAALYVVYKRKQQECEKLEKAYWAERRGRCRVEQEMRRISDVQLKTDKGFFVQPIGAIESCYRQCVGTPRQGLLVPSSRASMVLKSNVSPEAIDGLDEFSHVWLIFKFHKNTNTMKEAKAFEHMTSEEDKGKLPHQIANRKYTFTAKITPPMLKEKKGVYATRSPHRANPIGITLAKIEGVDKKKHRLMLSACDLVDGTPIYDIKPFVEMYDSAPNAFFPQWIMETIHTRNKVVIKDDILAKVERFQKKLKQYKNDAPAFLQGLRETLEVDVRSKFQTKRRIQDATLNIPVDVPFDNAVVRYLWKEERVMEVVDVTRSTQGTQLEESAPFKQEQAITSNLK
jgi:tRNA (Thr-GGU) A37 N-methylase